MVVFFVGGVFDVVYQGIYFYYFDVFKFGIEIFYFLVGIVDLVLFEFSGFQGLVGGYCFVQVGVGGVDFFGEQEWCMNMCVGQFVGVVIGWDVQVMFLSYYFDIVFMILNVDRFFNVCVVVVFQLKINRNCYGIIFYCVVKCYYSGMMQRVGLVIGRCLFVVLD